MSEEHTVPPGHTGADSGAVDAVKVEPGSTASVPNRSNLNDAAGVGSKSSSSGDTQDEPVMDQHAATDADKLSGIVQQARVDLADADPARIREVVAQRAEQSGLGLSDADIDAALAD